MSFRGEWNDAEESTRLSCFPGFFATAQNYKYDEITPQPSAAPLTGSKTLNKKLPLC